MGKIIKKGVKGAASNYITRNQAVKKLQVSLADFRRLCILKGIYPREPRNRKKAAGGSTAPKTFYFTKDIQFLMHEPLINKLRERKIHLRKVSKAQGKQQWAVVQKLEEQQPTFKLDHLVKERYPKFIDAIRDLDDCLASVFLFATMPVTDQIDGKRIKKCQHLAAEFLHYVIASKSLKKVFLSIKGIYYQAEIMHEKVTWIVPYEFSQQVPSDVDFRVMLTFLEFYETLLTFVNFKLYATLNLVYPPLVDSLKDAGATGLGALVVRAAETGDFAATTGEDAEVEGPSSLFDRCVVYLSREVPKFSLEFVIKAFGGKVGWDATLGQDSPFKEDDPRITHQICDRPVVQQKFKREYVQPQWIYDSVNAGMLLKLSTGHGETESGEAMGYGVGQPLPAHLSPFVDYKDEAYVPEEAEQQGHVAYSAAGDADKSAQAQPEAEVIKTDEQKKLAMMMMNKKDRRLYGQIQWGKKNKQIAGHKLREKKSALKGSKAQ